MSSAAIDNTVHAFNMESFQLHALFHGWESIKKMQRYMFPKIDSAWQGLPNNSWINSLAPGSFFI